MSAQYKENWDFFKTLRHAKAMEGRGFGLIMTNKATKDGCPLFDRGKPARQPKPEAESCSPWLAVAWSPDGNYPAGTEGNGVVHIYNPAKTPGVVEEIAARLREENSKARENGESYARITAQNASATSGHGGGA